MKTKLSLRTYSNENFYKDLGPINEDDESGQEDSGDESEKSNQLISEQYCPKLLPFQELNLDGYDP